MLHVTNGKAARVLIKGDSKYEARISGSVLVTENSPLTPGKREWREYFVVSQDGGQGPPGGTVAPPLAHCRRVNIKSALILTCDMLYH